MSIVSKISGKNIITSVWKHKVRTIVVVLGLILIYFLIIKPRFFPSLDKYDIAKVELGDVQEVLVLSGEIDADQRASLSFPTAGKISWVSVTEGQEIYKGQALMKLDTISLSSGLQQARSALRAAEATVDRVHDDVKDHDSDESFTQKEARVAAEAAKDRAYESVVQAEEALRNATLISPVSGTLTYLATSVAGVVASPAAPQAEVVDLNTLYFKVFADQSEVTTLHEGDRVEITLESYPEEVLSGVVERIGFSPNPQEVGVVYGVRVKFTEMSGVTPRIGMTGDAAFVMDTSENVLWVPPQFVQSDSDGKYVLVDEGKRKVRIEEGLVGEDRVEIRGDISEGTTVYND